MICRATAQQLRLALSADQWIRESELLNNPKWDKATVEMGLKLGCLLGAFRWRVENGEKEYIVTHK